MLLFWWWRGLSWWGWWGCRDNPETVAKPPVGTCLCCTGSLESMSRIRRDCRSSPEEESRPAHCVFYCLLWCLSPTAEPPHLPELVSSCCSKLGDHPLPSLCGSSLLLPAPSLLTGRIGSRTARRWVCFCSLCLKWWWNTERSLIGNLSITD